MSSTERNIAAYVNGLLTKGEADSTRVYTLTHPQSKKYRTVCITGGSGDARWSICIHRLRRDMLPRRMPTSRRMSAADRAAVVEPGNVDAGAYIMPLANWSERAWSDDEDQPTYLLIDPCQYGAPAHMIQVSNDCLLQGYTATHEVYCVGGWRYADAQRDTRWGAAPWYALTLSRWAPRPLAEGAADILLDAWRGPLWCEIPQPIRYLLSFAQLVRYSDPFLEVSDSDDAPRVRFSATVTGRTSDGDHDVIMLTGSIPLQRGLTPWAALLRSMYYHHVVSGPAAWEVRLPDKRWRRTMYRGDVPRSAWQSKALRRHLLWTDSTLIMRYTPGSAVRSPLPTLLLSDYGDRAGTYWAYWLPSGQPVDDVGGHLLDLMRDDRYARDAALNLYLWLRHWRIIDGQLQVDDPEDSWGYAPSPAWRAPCALRRGGKSRRLLWTEIRMALRWLGPWPMVEPVVRIHDGSANKTDLHAILDRISAPYDIWVDESVARALLSRRERMPGQMRYVVRNITRKTVWQKRLRQHLGEGWRAVQAAMVHLGWSPDVPESRETAARLLLEQSVAAAARFSRPEAG